MAHGKDSVTAPAHLLHREVWNRGDVALVGEILAEDYTQTEPLTATSLCGSQALRTSVTERRRGFPDLSRTIERTLVDGRFVGIQYVETGTHEGVLHGVEPTGRRFRIPGLYVGRVDDGRLREGLDLWDALGLLCQLGVSPADLDTVHTDHQP